MLRLVSSVIINGRAVSHARDYRNVAQLLARRKHPSIPTRQKHFSKQCFSSASHVVPETPGKGLMGLLTKEERDLLAEQRSLMKRALTLTSQVGVVSVQEYTGSFLENLVDETTFSIVVAGEFNAGKSTLINALLGKKVLETGALPTTDSITILTKSRESQDSVQKHNVSSNSGGGVIVHYVSKEVPLLDDLTFIDTPGTNAVLADHTARTLKLLPTADLILFVTSADRPFPESERALLSSIQNYRKSIVVVINKMDILEVSGGSYGQEEKQRVVNFVTDHASDLLGGRPMVIPVSSRDALSSKVMGRAQDTRQNSVWERSNFSTLESFLKDSLTMETKIKFKLTNPIGQVEGMVSASLEALKKEQKELELDVATIKLLKNQFAAWKKEMDAQMELFRTDVGLLLKTEAARCEVLLNRLGLLQFYKATLIDQSIFEHEFANTRPNFSSKQSLQADLLEHANETAESIATRGRAQGQAVIEFLGKRPAVKNQTLVGSVSAASRFEDTRKALADKLSGAIKAQVNVNAVEERQKLLSSLQRVAIISSGLQLGAVGAGLATTTQMVDMMMGMGAGSVMAMLGGAVFSQGRENVKRRHKENWDGRQERLEEALQIICSKELSRVERRILDGVAPYTRFVETERERLDRLIDTSEDILVQAQTLRNRIKNIR